MTCDAFSKNIQENKNTKSLAINKISRCRKCVVLNSFILKTGDFCELYALPDKTANQVRTGVFPDNQNQSE